MREDERENETERQTERQRDTHRQTETNRQANRQTQQYSLIELFVKSKVVRLLSPVNTPSDRADNPFLFRDNRVKAPNS